MFFPESNIWNEDTLRENVHDHDGSYNLDTEVAMVQTVSEKQEFMNVDAEIGLSFMGMTWLQNLLNDNYLKKILNTFK